MKTNWKAIGIAAVTAGLLYYPALKLYQYVTKRSAEGPEDGKEENHEHHVRPALLPVCGLSRPDLAVRRAVSRDPS